MFRARGVGGPVLMSKTPTFVRIMNLVWRGR